MDRSLLKRNAKIQLGNSIFSENWLLGLVACMIFSSCIYAAFSFISVISASVMIASGSFLNSSDLLLQEELPTDAIVQMSTVFLAMYAGSILFSVLFGLFVMEPLQYGLSACFLELVMGAEKIKIGSLFSGFRKYRDVVFLGFMRALRIILWSLLFLIPGIVKSYAYSQAYYVKIEHPDYTWRQCLNESEAIMRGFKFRFFVLQLSFIGWEIVGSLAFGIGILWVSPYEFCTFANFYAWRSASLIQNRASAVPGDASGNPFDAAGAPNASDLPEFEA